MTTWADLGLDGSGEVPRVAGSRSGTCVILGGAASVWEDNARAPSGARMAVNDAGAYYMDPLEHWVTLHPEYMPGWMRFRRGHCYGHAMTHSNREAEGIDIAWHMVNVGGTSGLFACKVALLLGYERVVLAGMPMDGSPHFFDPPWYRNTVFEDAPSRRVWEEAGRNFFRGRVTSMSGRTRDWLGEP